MATFKRFEDIESWQLAREFCKMVSLFIHRDELSKDYQLKDQINSESESIIDNIAEEFNRGGNMEFVNFLRYSKGSVGESQSQFYRAFDRNYITKNEFDEGYNLVDQINSKNQNMIKYL